MKCFRSRLRKLDWRHLLAWASLLALAIWAVQGVEWAQLLAALGRLRLPQLGLLIAINALVVLASALRLWLLAPAVGLRFQLLELVRYWLVGFSVSYFTPGPQLGGGPVQVYLMHLESEARLDPLIAAVGTSKLLERLGNAMFLSAGLLAIVDLHLFPGRLESLFLLADGILLALPLAYLVGLAAGFRPLASAAARLAKVAGWPRLADWKRSLAEIEGLAGDSLVRAPARVLLALMVSVASWLPVLALTWLALQFLGHPISIAGALATVAAAQLAFLTPLPAGLGALEGVLILSLTGLGAPSAVGVALTLLVRARDIAQGAIGLALGGGIALRLDRRAVRWIGEADVDRQGRVPGGDSH